MGLFCGGFACFPIGLLILTTVQRSVNHTCVGFELLPARIGSCTPTAALTGAEWKRTPFVVLTADMIENEMRKLFSIPDEKETRLWNRYMTNTFEPLNKPDSTIQDAGLYQGQVCKRHLLNWSPAFGDTCIIYINVSRSSRRPSSLSPVCCFLMYRVSFLSNNDCF